jgi:hypothetical protein
MTRVLSTAQTIARRAMAAQSERANAERTASKRLCVGPAKEERQ